MENIDPKVLTTVITSVGVVLAGIFGGGVFAYLGKYFLKRYIQENDKKHLLVQKELKINREKSHEDLMESRSQTHKELSALRIIMSDMVSDLKVNIALFNEFKVIKGTVDKDHENIIRLDHTTKLHDKDINAQHAKIRDITNRMEDVGKVVSGMRRLEEEHIKNKK